MKKINAIILSALALLSVACTKDSLQEKIETPELKTALVPMTFSAGTPATKTAIASNGKSVNWVAGDKIAVCDDISGEANEFAINGEGGSSSASFSGEVTEGSSEFYAVYPYSSDAFCIEGDIIGLTIPADQTTTASDISAGIMAAKADANNNFAFKNATAILKFNLTATNIAKIVITGAGDEKIAGEVELTVDETAAMLDESKLTEASITVGDGTTALTAGDYYVVIAPKDELSGLKFTFTSTDGLTAELSGGKVTIAAGDLLNLKTLNPNFTDFTVAQILEKVKAGADVTKLNVTGVVSYVETQGTAFSRGTVMLQDNVNKPNTGIAIFNNDASTGLYKSEDIKAGSKVKISLANASVSTDAASGVQLSGVTASDVIEEISADNEIVKATATAATISSFASQYVKIADVTPSFTGYMNTAGGSYTFKAGDETFGVYIKSASWKGADLLVSETMTGTLFGFVGYNKTWQILPVYAEDIKELVDTAPKILSVSASELKWASSEYGSDNVKTVTVTGQYMTTENLSVSLSDNKSFSSSLVVDEDGKGATVSVYPVAENATGTAIAATLTISLGETSNTVALTQAQSGEVATLLTTELTNANIVAAGSANKNYASWTFTDDNKYEYKVKCIKNQHSNATSSYHYIQIKKGTEYYIELPQLPGDIVSIEMTVSGSNKAMSAGGNTATLSLYDSSTSTTAIVSAKGDSSITLTVPEGKEVTKGYIGASGAIRIWNIKITYYSL